MKKLLSIAVLSLLAFVETVGAQDKPFYLGVTLGYNSFLSIDASNSTSGHAVAASPCWTDKGAVLGIEAGTYLSPNMRLIVGGGFNRTVNPAHAATYGAPAAGIPSYAEEPNRTNMNYAALIGGDFCIGSENVKPYVGVRGRGTYGFSKVKYIYDQAVIYNDHMIAETWNIGGAVVLGADCIVSGSLILGCQFDLLSYTYAAVRYKQEPGLKPNEGRCSSLGFIASPMLRVGFNF